MILAKEDVALSACLESAPSITPIYPSADAHAARFKKFQREQLIVDYLNRGVSAAEIAARVGVGEKRMRTVIKEILARRMPAPPEEFLAIQVSRLNEALLVAHSAMTGANLKAVDRVVRIVRELDRYHGFFAAARRHPEATPLEAPVDGTAAFGAALVCRPKFALQDFETIEFALGTASGPLNAQTASPDLVLSPRLDPEASKHAPVNSDGAARSSMLRDATRCVAPQHEGRECPFARDDRPQNLPQDLEKIESAPGFATAAEASGAACAAREQARAFARVDSEEDVSPIDALLTDCPESPPQSLEKVESAPGGGPLAPLQRGEGWGEGRGRLAAVGARRAPPPGLDPRADPLPVIPESSPGREKGRSAAPADDDRPQIPQQTPEKIESAPGGDPLAPLQRGEGWGEGLGRLAAVGARQAPPPGLDPGADLLPVIPGSSPGREKGRSVAPAGDDRPQIPQQTPEKIESAPGDITPLVLTPTGWRRQNVRMTLNGVAAC